eukprot:RCo050522
MMQQHVGAPRYLVGADSPHAPVIPSSPEMLCLPARRSPPPIAPVSPLIPRPPAAPRKPGSPSSPAISPYIAFGSSPVVVVQPPPLSVPSSTMGSRRPSVCSSGSSG